MRKTIGILIALAALAAGCGDGGGKTAEIPSGGETPAPAATTETATEAADAPEGCTAAEQPEPKKDGGQKKPSGSLDASKKWTATVVTNCGEFTILLDLKKAPKTAASFVALAKAGFYDDTIFHRIVPGFVIQGGDPTGTGSGGPGYKTVDKPPASTKYTKGVVAMAKGGTEAPGTSGSQFFVVTGDAAQLRPDYAVLGKVTKGMKVADRIGELGDQSEQPTAVVKIETVRIANG